MSTLADRVKETFTTTGAGDLTLLGAEVDHQSFFQAQGLNKPTEYFIIDGVNGVWEAGIGENTTSTNFERTTVLINSAGTQPSALNLGAGTKLIICDRSAVTIAALFNQGLATTDSPQFDKLSIGTSDINSSLTVGSTDATAVITSGGANTHLSLKAMGPSGVLILGAGGVANGTPGTEAMRIDSSQNVLVAVTSTLSTNYRMSLLCKLAGGGMIIKNNAATGVPVAFLNSAGTGVGTISTSNTATTYGSPSDHRLKKNVAPMVGATAQTKLLRPCNFDWILDGSNVDGFIAHELAEVVPGAVTGTRDAMRAEEYELTPATGDVFAAGSKGGFTEISAAIEASPAYYDIKGDIIKEEVIARTAVHKAYDAVAEVIHSTNVERPNVLKKGQQWRETTAKGMGVRSVPDMQGIDQAKLVPLLTATIQELMVRIEALERG